MSTTIRVLKHFRFSAPAEGRLPSERIFTPGDHEIDDEIADHPWIRDHLADGAIETPEAAVERTKLAHAKAEQAKLEADAAKATAEAAFERLVRTQGASAKASELSAEQLNTKVGELRAKQDGVNETADSEAKGNGKKKK